MLRFAKEEDVDHLIPILFQIFDDMELEVFNKVGREKMMKLIREGFFQSDYRYGYKNILVEEIEGKIAGLSVGYPEELEDDIDQPMQKIMQKHGIDSQTLFDDKEAWPGEWYLDSFAISKDLQNQGIGTKMLKELIEWVKNQGEKTLSLNVDTKNDRARHVYEKLGFKKVGELYIGTHLYEHMQLNLI
ncbi:MULTISPECIES: GNAT family N-acetyltransferase [Lactobacillaceae]|uniref:GNAT family N-acetyltransferase n=1 Tax=Lactobacillaceae TaxID=33958 RepID=UPI000C1B6EAE|nr:MULTISPECIES: GNAT family N-acetyltransferase [Lactobacillaceae]